MEKSRRISRSYKTLHIGTGVRVQGCHIMIFTPFKTDLAWYTPQRFIAQGLGSSGHWTVWPRVFESWNLELPWYTYSFQKFYEILLAISFQKCEGKHDIQLVVVCSKMSLESRTNACFFESVSSHPRTTSRNPSSKLKVCRQFPKCPHDPTKTNNIHIDPPKCFLLDILGHAHKLWSFVFLFICNSWENKQQNTILTVTEIHSAARRKRNLHNRAGNVVFLCVVDQSPTLTLTIWTSKLGKQTLIQLMIETYQHHIKHLLHLPHQERNNKKLQFLEPQKPFA